MATEAEAKAKVREHLYREALERGASEELAARTADALLLVADAPRWPPKFKGRSKILRRSIFAKLRADGLSKDDAERGADILTYAAVARGRP